MFLMIALVVMVGAAVSQEVAVETGTANQVHLLHQDDDLLGNPQFYEMWWPNLLKDWLCISGLDPMTWYWYDGWPSLCKLVTVCEISATSSLDAQVSGHMVQAVDLGSFEDEVEYELKVFFTDVNMGTRNWMVRVLFLGHTWSVNQSDSTCFLTEEFTYDDEWEGTNDLFLEAYIEADPDPYVSLVPDLDPCISIYYAMILPLEQK